ncbi:MULTISPECIES: glycoside hydrolase [unclassified Massilia]|uniref:WD40/YVTN/BNR-like repeat-containing protein n=1 Tax=unclassified Massilia TaxID=2609279 RepID=UPI001B826FD2|nr:MULTISPECIES: glycoside hydrolase [unclassified Massilia]MBQ5940895.1 exo-alpha-sialidase [Massilia sp. AB1]MBQ5964556.1 exo-alpha-sialidase [Massilia sp. ZL223]
MSMQAYVATRKGLFELSFTGSRWEFGPVHFLGDPVSMVLPDRRDGTLYAALNLGHFGVKLHRKQGEIWTELPAPAYPPKPEGLEEKVEWTNKLIWSLEAGGADQPGVLWAGTLPGGLFRSGDRGDSWELVRPLWDMPGRPQWFGGGYDDPGIHSISVDPRDSRSLLVGISCAGAWRTEDGGASWALSARGMRADYMPPDMQDNEEAQDPHRIVRCAGEPDVLWCQHHNGVWRSGDAGRSWQEIRNMPLSHFGFAVAAHPRDGQTAWFVPAEKDERRIPLGASLAVTRTRDGGKTFDVLRAGLPQEHCYDLVYRHGLAVHEDGRTLIMGSTTGNVWVSDNGGDSWHAVAGNLPPVYAVAFA